MKTCQGSLNEHVPLGGGGIFPGGGFQMAHTESRMPKVLGSSENGTTVAESHTEVGEVRERHL